MAHIDDEELTRKDIRYKPAEPDVYVRCPYFPEHELRRSRLPYHIIRCQTNPDAPKLMACPYNYLHRVRPEDREEHMRTCEDRVFRRKNPPASLEARANVEALGKRKQTTDAVPPETGETEWW